MSKRVQLWALATLLMWGFGVALLYNGRIVEGIVVVNAALMMALWTSLLTAWDLWR